MFLIILQTVVSVLLIAVILMQSQGSGMSAVYGGGGEFYRSRRSLERFFIGATIFLASVFALLSLLLLILH